MSRTLWGTPFNSRTCVAAVVAAAVAFVLTLWIPAVALESEAIEFKDGSQKVHKEYPPIPGQNPAATAANPTIAQCRDLPSEVLIPIGMDFKKDFGHVLELTVNWEAPEANDIDIYFFDEAGEIIADSASMSAPEVVRLGSLANGQYYLCIRNFSGVNTGFVLDGEVRFLTLFTRTPAPPTSAPGTSVPRRRSADTTPQPGAGGLKAAPVVTADPVDTPGPDGPFADRRLINVAGSRQAAPEEGGLSVTQIVFFTLTGVIAAGGLGVVAFRIRRDMRG